MVENLISLRPRKNRVVLFNPLLNWVDWKAKWVVVQCRVGFPFRPLVGYCLKWDPIVTNTKLSTSDKKFLSIVSAALGDDLQSLTKVYSTANLLSRDSLSWCGIRSGLKA